MGNANHPSKNPGGESDSSTVMKGSPLLFHSIHSDNVQISADGRTARRIDSFCKGICFSARRVAVDERVCVRVCATSTLWSGVLRFGFTRYDPACLRPAELPRYACPDLTSRPGFWARALPERFARAGATLTFRLTRAGYVLYTVDGEDKGVFFSGVELDSTISGLWALIDIYGNTTATEFVDCSQLNNISMSPTAAAPATLPSPLPPADAPPPVPHATTPPVVGVGSTSSGGTPALQAMPFHTRCGRNICLSPDRTVAVRLRHAPSNGYAFTERPIQCGQRLIIQVLSLLSPGGPNSGLGFGMTAADPARVPCEELPDDADQLLDRPEYWVVHKDVCSPLDVADQLSFHLTMDGEVLLSKNGQLVASLMHVDKTLPMWMFFDVYGNTQKVKSLGVISHDASNLRVIPPSRLTVTLPPASTSRTPPPRPPPLRVTVANSSSTTTVTTSTPPSLPPKQYKSAPPPSRIHHSSHLPLGLPAPLIPTPVGRPPARPTPAVPQVAPPVPQVAPPAPVLPAVTGATAAMSSLTSDEDADNASNANSECAVCFERTVNCVLYKCGHMCVCYECATDIVANQGALCPICRNQICDIIKIYRS